MLWVPPKTTQIEAKRYYVFKKQSEQPAEKLLKAFNNKNLGGKLMLRFVIRDRGIRSHAIRK